MAAAGIQNNLELDGVNLIPYLKGKLCGNPHEKLFWRKLDEAAVRLGSKKLVRLKDYGSTLYKLDVDLGETTDLSNLDETTSNLLNQELKAWESTLMKPLWDEGDWMPVTYHIHESLMENKVPLYTTPERREKYLKNQLNKSN